VTPERSRTLRRVAFWGYAALLFTGTHWPELTLPGEGRPDLYIHFTIFGLWTAFLIGAGFFGPPLSSRNIIGALAVAPVYAALDEGLQAIPWVRRHAAFDDWCCNVGGILVACAGAAALRYVLNRRAGGPG
jgi:hypothetical protein